MNQYSRVQEEKIFQTNPQIIDHYQATQYFDCLVTLAIIIDHL